MCTHAALQGENVHESIGTWGGASVLAGYTAMTLTPLPLLAHYDTSAYSDSPARQQKGSGQAGGDGGSEASPICLTCMVSGYAEDTCAVTTK